MSDLRKPASSRTPSKVLGTMAQVAGVLGVLIGVILAVLVLLGRGRAAERLDEIASKIDSALAKGVPLLAAARDRVDGTTALVASIGKAVEARADETGPVSDLAQELREKAKALSDRYMAIRVTYAEAHEKVAAALDRLSTIDRLAPIFSVPRGPVEALDSLDERVRTLDADVMELLSAIPNAGSGQAAAAIAEKVGKVEAALAAMSMGLGDTETRFDGLRARTAAWVDATQATITVVSIALILVFLYSSLLHWVLYRWGSQTRRGEWISAGP